jgi:hypothetical protein
VLVIACGDCGGARLALSSEKPSAATRLTLQLPVAENSEYAAFARRILRAYSRRIAGGDVESLAQAISLSDDINNTIRQAVGLRSAGYPWAEIGARLGTTRQAAQQRWGRPR